MLWNTGRSVRRGGIDTVDTQIKLPSKNGLDKVAKTGSIGSPNTGP